MYAPKPKCHDTDYIDFLIASPKAFCCTEAAAVQPESSDARGMVKSCVRGSFRRRASP
jgi:hypothetical protein